MSYQVVRVQSFTKGSLKNILAENDRTDGEVKNVGRDETLAHLNYSYKDLKSGGAYATFDQILKECDCKPFVDKKKAVAFEGVVVTASPEFFEQLGWVKGEPAPEAVKEYFDKAYALVLEQFGFRGTDKNILSAKVHYDETTPHLQVDYIPIVENYKKKVYEKDEDGKVLRSERGTPIQAKDENGKTLFEEIKGVPKVARADFWRERGGKNSYTKLQDTFYEKLGKGYGLERGEVGSNAEHETNHQYHKRQQEAELAEISEQARVARLNEIKTTPRPVFLEHRSYPPAPETKYQVYSKQEEREYKKQWSDYKSACRDVDKHNKEVDKQNEKIKLLQEDWDRINNPLQLLRDEAERLEIQRKKQEAVEVQQQQTAEALNRLKQEIPEEIEKGIKAQLARSEQYAGFRTNQQASMEYQRRLQAIHERAKERNEQYDNQSVSTEQNRSQRTKPSKEFGDR